MLELGFRQALQIWKRPPPRGPSQLGLLCPVYPEGKKGTCPSIASRQHGAALHWDLFQHLYGLSENTIWVSSEVLEAMLEVQELQEASDCLCSE